MQIEVERILNSYWIKYDRLEGICNTVFANCSSKGINLYIDMYSMIETLYKSPDCIINDQFCIASSVINMCAHYRHFFRSRYGVETRIMIVHSDNTAPHNNLYCPGYNTGVKSKSLVFKRLSDLVRDNVELLSILCPYLPDIHFYSTTYESSVVMFNIMNRLDKSIPNVIITKDQYAYQLIKDDMFNVIFRPKKHNGIDNSYWVDNNNLYQLYFKERKLSEKNIPMSMGLSVELYSALLALTAVPSRNLKSITMPKLAMKIIKNSIESRRIINGYNVPMTLMQFIDLSGTNIRSSELESRFKAIDIRFQQLAYSESIESKNLTMENLYDPEAMKAINNRYFHNTPLDLNAL